MKDWFRVTLQQAAWAPLIVFCFHLFADHAFPVSAFTTISWLDIPTHLAGGLAMAYFVLIAISHAQRLCGQIPQIIQNLLAFGMTCMIAIAWEFMEFASDKWLGSQLNMGVSDTLCDLLMGMLGAAVCLVFMAYQNTRKERLAADWQAA